MINNVTVIRVTCPKQIENHPDTENGHGQDKNEGVENAKGKEDFNR